MVEPTDIEKKSLEAHVELCAERYNALETKINGVDEKINGLNIVIKEVRDKVTAMSEKRNDQLVGWGIGIICFLTGTIGWMLSQYVFK